MSCTHVTTQVVSAPQLLAAVGAAQGCVKCKKSGEVWICLTAGCGFVGCGRLEKAHMLQHTKDRPTHGLVMNVMTTLVWCYACDDEVTDDIPEIEIFRNSLIQRNTAAATLSPVISAGAPKGSQPKGSRGLVNVGNTCFLAACIQCLSHVPPFQKLLRHCPPYSSHELQGVVSPAQRLVIAVRNFFLEQWSSDPVRAGPVRPDEILSAVQRLNSMFHGYHQHDSQEFLRFVLSSLHEELRVDGDSVVSDVFRGKTKSTVTCVRCRTQSVCKEEFFDLSLSLPDQPVAALSTPGVAGPKEAGKEGPVKLSTVELEKLMKAVTAPGGGDNATTTTTSSWLWSRAKSLIGLGQSDASPITVMDCLNQFLLPELLTGSEAYFCEHCKAKNDCVKQMTIDTFPETLVLHLKRFRQSDWGASTKVKRVVHFPVGSDLDLSVLDPGVGGAVVDHVVGGKKVSKKNSAKSKPAVSLAAVGTGLKYRLVGFVRHMGSMGGGHYIAYCRHKSTGQWLCFDDTRVSLVTDIASIESAEPYVLFFQRVPDLTVIGERKLLKAAKEASSAAGGTYLPKKFTCMVQTMSRDPPFTSRGGAGFGTVCVHGKPSTACPVFVKTQFVLVSQEYAKRVERKAIGNNGELNTVKEEFVAPSSLEVCLECQLFVKAYNQRLALEHKLVSKLDTKGISEGTEWYLIDSAWVGKWRMYLRHGAISDSCKAQGPGKIDNAALVGKMEKNRTGLKLTSDYIAVNRNVWTVFAHAHGIAGPVVSSPSLEIAHAKVVPDANLATHVETGVSEDDWNALSHTFVDQERGQALKLKELVDATISADAAA